MRLQITRKPAERPKTVSDPLRGFRIVLMGLLIFLAYLTMGGRRAAEAPSNPSTATTMASSGKLSVAMGTNRVH